MRIGIDARCLEENNISGVGEYALEIFKNLLEVDKKNEYIFFSNSYRHKYNRNFEWLKKYPAAKLKIFTFPNRILNLLFWYFNRPKINTLLGGVDIFFMPNINFVPLGKECNFTAAFHDLSFERFPQLFPLKTRIWHFLINPRKLARKAAKIIAVSESTASDLQNIYGVRRENISIIPSGLSEEYRIIDKCDPNLKAVQKKYRLPDRFILTLGTIEPRKNIISLIKAYENWRDNALPLAKYKLVLIGKTPSLLDRAIHQYIAKSKYRRDIIQTGYVKSLDKVYLYNLASLFVYPSFFEGFGFPPLEAIASGTPTITSNNSSLPEVVGKAAVLVDPTRPQEIAEAIQAVLSDKKLNNYLVVEGLKRKINFDWEKCARETLVLFQKAPNS